MRVLLPPSETKRSGGGSISFSRGFLAHDDALGATRARVSLALEALCAGTDVASEDAAAKVLKLGVRARGEIAHNRALASSPTMPAIERYTGVLYDALGADTLAAPARSWLTDHVSIQSSLFGLIHADDLIPAYRLSASSPLAVASAAAKPLSLKAQWRDAHAQLSWTDAPLIVDLRSKDYAALAPLPAAATAVSVEVLQRGPDGQTRALNHFNKHAKGDLVRRLAESGDVPATVSELLDWAVSHDIELMPGSAAHTLALVTDLGAPAHE